MIYNHINRRSLPNKRELENIVEQFKSPISSVQETLFDGSVSPKEYVPDGYKIIRHDRTELFKTKYGKNNGGGVAILYKEHIKIQTISLITDSIEYFGSGLKLNSSFCLEFYNIGRYIRI